MGRHLAVLERLAWLVAVGAPVLCGRMSEAVPDSLLPHLAFLVAGPLAGLAALISLFLPWQAHRRSALLGTWS